MADDKTLRCDCGYRLRAGSERRQVAEVRRHAWDVHGIWFSPEDALAVLLRFELELGDGAPLASATVEQTETGKEKQ